MIFITCLLVINLAPNFLKDSPSLSTGIIAFSVVYSIITIYYKVFLPTLDSSTNISDNLFIQTWGHSYIADFLILAIPILLTRLQSKFKIIELFLTAFIGLAIAITNSRSAMIGLIVSIILIKINRIYKYIFICLVAFAFCFTLFFANNLKTPTGSRPQYWSQAINSIITNPWFGNGPGNFGVINRLYRSDSQNSTNYAHNSILEMFSANGVFYTLLFFYLIFLGLKYQYQHHYLFFVLGTTSFVNSLLDPTWSNPGLFCLALIFIFWKIPYQQNSLLFKFLTIVVSCFLISKITSDILFLKGNYPLSLKFDPFNPNSLTKTLPSNYRQTFYYYRHDPVYYLSYVNQTSLPDNAQYYHSLFTMDPHGSVSQYVKYLEYSYRQLDWSQVAKTIKLIKANVSLESTTSYQRHTIAKISYFLALNLWQNQQAESSLEYFQFAQQFSDNYSHFYIELAAAYYHLGQTSNAENIIQKCLQITLSQLHCSQYSRADNLPTPGHLADSIARLSY